MILITKYIWQLHVWAHPQLISSIPMLKQMSERQLNMCGSSILVWCLVGHSDYSNSKSRLDFFVQNNAEVFLLVELAVKVSANFLLLFASLTAF
jgi:hypothetical protein